jgi:hypothetical protein
MTKEVIWGDQSEQFYRYNLDDGRASGRTIGLGG